MGPNYAPGELDPDYEEDDQPRHHRRQPPNHRFDGAATTHLPDADPDFHVILKAKAVGVEVSLIPHRHVVETYWDGQTQYHYDETDILHRYMAFTRESAIDKLGEQARIAIRTYLASPINRTTAPKETEDEPNYPYYGF